MAGSHRHLRGVRVRALEGLGRGRTSDQGRQGGDGHTSGEKRAECQSLQDRGEAAEGRPGRRRRGRRIHRRGRGRPARRPGAGCRGGTEDVRGIVDPEETQRRRPDFVHDRGHRGSGQTIASQDEPGGSRTGDERRRGRARQGVRADLQGEQPDLQGPASIPLLRRSRLERR